MSVEERSCFSYQVAAGNTMSDSKVVLVMRKSADIRKSSLPSGPLLMPFHVLRFQGGLAVLAHHVVVGAEQVAQEVLVALGRGTKQVGAPQHEGARPVFRGVDVLDGGVQGPVLQGLRATQVFSSGASPAATAAMAWSAMSRGFVSNWG